MCHLHGNISFTSGLKPVWSWKQCESVMISLLFWTAWCEVHLWFLSHDVLHLIGLLCVCSPLCDACYQVTAKSFFAFSTCHTSLTSELFFHTLNHAGHVSLQKEGLFGEHIIRGDKITKDYKPIKYALSQDLELV